MWKGINNQISDINRGEAGQQMLESQAQTLAGMAEDKQIGQNNLDAFGAGVDLFTSGTGLFKAGGLLGGKSQAQQALDEQNAYLKNILEGMTLKNNSGKTDLSNVMGSTSYSTGTKKVAKPNPFLDQWTALLNT